MTEEREHNSKVTKIKEIFPILWSSYEHMFEARETGIKSSINFLMIIVTFLPILCLTLYLKKARKWYFVYCQKSGFTFKSL